MSATDVITLTFVILGFSSAPFLYWGMVKDIPAMTGAAMLIASASVTFLTFIFFVTLGSIVVADTIG